MTESDNDKLEMILANFVMWCGNSLANAWAFQLIWNWFVTPLGVMSLSYGHAWALGLMATWLGVMVYSVPHGNNEYLKSPPGYTFIVLFVKTLAMLFVCLMAALANTFLM